jgi:hypothetical protein
MHWDSQSFHSFLSDRSKAINVEIDETKGRTMKIVGRVDERRTKLCYASVDFNYTRKC